MNNQYQPAIRNFLTLPVRCVILLLALFAGMPLAQATDRVKANNTDNLNLITSWSGAVVPTATDIGVWDSTVSGVLSNSTGASLSWSGVRVTNPGGAITIWSNTLTIGVDGIDMSAATQDLSMSNAVTIGPRYQNWNVAPGRSLKILALPNKPGTGTATEGIVEFSTTGTINVGVASLGLILDSQNNPWCTYGKSDWAATDGSGNVIPVTYTPWTASVGTAFGINADVTGSFTQTGNGGWNSIRFADTTTVQTVTNASGTTFTGRGVLVAPGCVGGVITGAGFLRPNRQSTVAATSFDFIQNSTVGDLTIGSSIPNGSSGAPVKLVKAGPGKMIVTVGCSYTGGTVVHSGVLQVNNGGTLSSGPVLVNNGRVAFFSGSTQVLPSLTLNTGCTNTVTITAANGSLVGVTNLILSAGSTHLEFSWNNAIPVSTTTAPLIVTTGLTNTGTTTIDIYSSSLAVGSYPLVKYAALGGTGNYVLGFLPSRVTAHVNTNIVNSSIDLVVDSVSQPITWATGNGTWDISGTPNWQTTLAASTTYQELNSAYGKFGDSVLFEDTLSGASPLSVTLNVPVSPAGTTVNASKNYTITGTGSIAGIGGLTKSGSGTLTLQTANSFAGGLNVNGGIVSFSALTNLGAGTLSFGGGTLQYNGNTDDLSVRTITLNPGGGTIDTAGQTVTFASPIGAGTGGGLTKAGAGSLTLNGTNRYTGPTIVSQGTLALAANSYVSNSAAIIVNGTLDTTTSSVNLGLSTPANQLLGGTGTVLGNVTAPVSTTLSPATNGVYGTLHITGNLTNSGGSLVMDIATTNHDQIAVTGSLAINSGFLVILTNSTPFTNGVYTLITYSGSLLSGPGSSGNLTVTGFSQSGKSATLSDATAGRIDLIVADSANDNLSWSGTGANWDSSTFDWLNGASAWAFTNGDIVRFDDAAAGNSTVQLQSTLQPSLVTVSNTAITPYTFADGTLIGGGKVGGTGSLVKDGAGTLIVQTANTYSGPTTIKNGTLQIGNGGIGDIGTGNVTNNAALVFSQGDGNLHGVAGQVSGTGSLTVQGTAAVVLAKDSIYTGATTIGIGASLQVGNGGTTGTVGANVVTNNGTFVINRSGTVSVPNNITGSGALTQIGAATTTFAGSLSYQGNTYVNNGMMKLTGNNQIPDANSASGSTGWLILDGGSVSAGKLDLSGFNETVNALSGTNFTVNGVITNSGTLSTTTNVLIVLGTASTTFAGSISDSASGSKTALVLLGTNTLTLSGNSTYSGGTYVGGSAQLTFANPAVIGNNGNITMSNGTTFFMTQNGGGASPNNNITIPDGASVNFNSSALGNVYGGNIFGGPSSTNMITGPVSINLGGVAQYSNFLGTVVIPSGGTLRFSSTSLTLNGGENTVFDLEGGTLQTRNAGTVRLGALTGKSGFISNPQANTGTGVFQIGFKNTDTTFSGGITATNAIVKVGTGRLTLNGGTAQVISLDENFNLVTNTIYTNLLSYVGNTTISNGVLALAAPVQINNSPVVTLASATAVLDASKMGFPDITQTNLVTNGVFEVVSAQTLAGIGTIRATSVILDSGSIFNVGLPLGSLTATNSVELAGLVNMSVNVTNTPNSSRLLAQNFIVDGTASLVVTNMGPENYGVFQLFNHPVSIPSVTLPTLTGTNIWANNLAVDGSITLVAPPLVNTTPTNMTATVSGNTLTLAWPADHTGWHLQIQTNILSVGLVTNAANWVTLPGSELVNTTNMTINPANGTVFYRMVYP